MSVTHSAYAVLGIRVPIFNWLTRRKVKTFDHNYPDSYILDPTSGRTLWTDEYVAVIEEIEEWGVNECPPLEKDVITWVRYSHDTKPSEGGWAYVGLVAKIDEPQFESRRGGGGEMMPVTQKHIDYVKGRIKPALEKAKLWKDELFGVWPVLHCSY
jgi:hypothetical protein